MSRTEEVHTIYDINKSFPEDNIAIIAKNIQEMNQTLAMLYDLLLKEITLREWSDE